MNNRDPATSAGSLFLSWLCGLVVIESLDPLEDVRLPPASGAFRDVKRLRKVSIRRVCFLPNGAHSDAEHGCNLGVRQQQLHGSRECHFVFSARSHFLSSPLVTAKPNKAADGDRQAGNDRGAGSHWAEVVGDPVVQAESGGDAGQGCHVPNAEAGAKLARAAVPGVGAVAVPEFCPDHLFEVG